MSLVFGAATSNRSRHGSAASLDNRDPFTYAAWVNVTTLTNNRAFFGKGTSNKLFRLSGAAGNLELFVGRTVTSTSFITNDTPIATNTWIFIAATYDSAGAAGEVVNIFTGTLASNLVERTYGTAIDGIGLNNDDSALNQDVGNTGQAAPANAIQGRIAWAGIWNVKLTLAELRALQFRPRVTSGCVLNTWLGFNGIGTQPDWSGNANSGTVTGATLGVTAPLAPQFYRGGGDMPHITAAAAASVAPPPYQRRTRIFNRLVRV